MTTYSGESYEEPGSIEEWLEEKGAQAYAAVFSWPIEKVHSEYSELFEKIEKYLNEDAKLLSEFEQISQTRKIYMNKNGIRQWSDLDTDRDAGHFEKQQEFTQKIYSIQSVRKEMKKEADKSNFPIRLLAGIIDGSYSNFNSIIDDERMTHGLTSSNYNDHLWQIIGPIHNWFWDMYPRLV